MARSAEKNESCGVACIVWKSIAAKGFVEGESVIISEKSILRIVLSVTGSVEPPPIEAAMPTKIMIQRKKQTNVPTTKANKEAKNTFTNFIYLTFFVTDS